MKYVSRLWNNVQANCKKRNGKTIRDARRGGGRNIIAIWAVRVTCFENKHRSTMQNVWLDTQNHVSIYLNQTYLYSSLMALVSNLWVGIAYQLTYCSLGTNKNKSQSLCRPLKPNMDKYYCKTAIWEEIAKKMTGCAYTDLRNWHA